MYDDTGTGCALSESYFSILQILRIASEWVKESMDDLERLVAKIEEFYFFLDSIEGSQFVKNDAFLRLDPAHPEEAIASIKAFKESWAKVVSYQQEIDRALQARIEKKSEEIKTLRDGVSDGAQRSTIHDLFTNRSQLFNATSVSEAAKSVQLNKIVFIFTVVTIFYLPLGFIAVSRASRLFFSGLYVSD